MKQHISTLLIFFGVFVGSLIGTFLVIEKVFNQDTPLSGPPVITSSNETLSQLAAVIPSASGRKDYPVLSSIDQVNLATKNQDQNLISLIVTGDVLLARSVNTKMTQLNDFTWPFQKTKEKLEQADITFINLETPLISVCPLRSDGMIFCGDTRSVDGLIYSGVDIVSLANNHAGNWNIDGVKQTEQTLQRANIKTTGVNDIALKEVKNVTFAFLGFNEVDIQPGVPRLNEQLLTQKITEAQEVADVVIVQFHWGQEYTYQPTTNQKRWAHLAVDLGADVVVGNHPHWWQPLEFYKNKLIVYSHGNFVFDQMWSYETREGLVGEYFFDGKNLVDVKFHPVFIEDYGQPRWIEGGEKEKVIEKFLDKSKNFLVN